MRTISSNTCRLKRGHMMITAAIASAILAILVAGYLKWVTNEYVLTERSSRYTQALHLCEAGIEVALAELNFAYRHDDPQAFGSSNGWKSAGANSYSKTVTGLREAQGRVVGDFTVTVTSVHDKYPVITAMATVTGPLGSPLVSRNLRVVVKRNAVFKYGFVAKTLVEIRSASGSIVMDSYDSSNPEHSTGSQYDPLKRTTNGNVACLSGANPSVSLRNASIYGVVATGVGGTVAMTSSSVGATDAGSARATTEAQGVNLGWIRKDFQMDIPNVQVPQSLHTAPNLGDISGSYTFNGGDWRVGRLRNTTGTIYVNGHVRLYVTQDVVLSGNSSLTVNPGGSLTVYVTGNMTASGRGVVNDTGVAENCVWYGTVSSSSWDLAGTSGFTGAVYAPQATLTLGGNTDFSGAFVGNRITSSGNPSFHYDEALGNGHANNTYTVMSWQPVVERNGSLELETNL